jgi:hypothetical protein
VASDRQSARRAAMLTAGVGIAHAVLFVLSFWLLAGTPGARAPDVEIREFYGSEARRRLTLVGLYIMPFAGISFVWFIVALRMWISHNLNRENVLLSNVQLVSGILFVAMFFASAATSAAAAASAEYADAIDPDMARQLPMYGQTLMFVFALRMAAMFVFTTSNIARAAGILPRWFTLAGFGVGLFLLLSATFTTLLALVFPLWMVCLCSLLIVRARHLPEDMTVPEVRGAWRQVL